MNRYRFTKIKKDTTEGFQHRVITEYPIITPKNSDRIYYSKQGERWDNIAYKFYQDTSLWWIIARANNQSESIYTIPGKEYRIPQEKGLIFQEFNELNS